MTVPDRGLQTEGSVRSGLAFLGIVLPLIGGSAAVASEDRLTPSFDGGTYVTDCGSGEDAVLCKAEQQRWAIVFDTALSGDLNAQKLVAQCLATGCGDLVTVDAHHACGWALLRSWATSKGTNNQLIKKINYGFYQTLCEDERDIDYKTSAIVARQLNDRIYKAYRPSSGARY
jgi:hypothetical protein